jgi:tetratricopeptide (TPR) repeat protein
MKVRITLLSVVLFVQGCIQTIAIRSMSGIMDNGFRAYFRESDLDFAREGMAGNLKLLEALVDGDPENEHLLLLAAQGYGSYALAFAEDDSVERARHFYMRGRDYGLRILRQNSALDEALKKDLRSFEEALGHLSRKDVPGVFWTAFCWGGYINISRSDLEAMADLSKVLAMMQFVLREDPSYYYAGAHLFLGAINASIPPMLGGKPDLAKEHFEKAMELHGGRFLMTYIYYAKTYAVQMQDQALFEELLKKVDDASIDILPEARLPNAVAKRKALLLRAKIPELF